ncbi:MAG: hypothetical protein VW270_13165 [Candidatus Poseidoniales archaeon]|jgi:hypothetical protein
MNNDLSQAQVDAILDAARRAAEREVTTLSNKEGGDYGACGFAWVNIHGVKGNSKLGRKLKAAGVTQDYTRAFTIWNPGGYGGQNVNIKEAGAEAYATVLESYGFRAYAGSRLD